METRRPFAKLGSKAGRVALLWELPANPKPRPQAVLVESLMLWAYREVCGGGGFVFFSEVCGGMLQRLEFEAMTGRVEGKNVR